MRFKITNDARQEGGRLLHAADADGAVDDNVAVRRKAHGGGVLDGEVEAVRIKAQVHGVQHVLDDLAEGQGHDGEIVAPQAQHRDADEEAEHAGHHTADEHGERKAQHRGHFRAGDDPEHRAGESAHAHKARMAQAQLAQDAHGEVQRDSKHHIGADGHQHALHGVVQHAAHGPRLHDDVEYHDDAVGDQIAARGLFHIFQCVHHSHLTPSRSWACPKDPWAAPAAR